MAVDVITTPACSRAAAGDVVEVAADHGHRRSPRRRLNRFESLVELLSVGDGVADELRRGRPRGAGKRTEAAAAGDAIGDAAAAAHCAATRARHPLAREQRPRAAQLAPPSAARSPPPTTSRQSRRRAPPPRAEAGRSGSAAARCAPTRSIPRGARRICASHRQPGRGAHSRWRMTAGSTNRAGSGWSSGWRRPRAARAPLRPPQPPPPRLPCCVPSPLDRRAQFLRLRCAHRRRRCGRRRRRRRDNGRVRRLRRRRPAGGDAGGGGSNAARCRRRRPRRRQTATSFG